MAQKEFEKRNDFTPMQGSFPDAKKIACRDCMFRDKTIVELCGKKIAAGITKSFCKMYQLKPNDVLFLNKPCQFYRKDETAPPHVKEK